MPCSKPRASTRVDATVQVRRLARRESVPQEWSEAGGVAVGPRRCSMDEVGLMRSLKWVT